MTADSSMLEDGTLVRPAECLRLIPASKNTVLLSVGGARLATAWPPRASIILRPTYLMAASSSPADLPPPVLFPPPSFSLGRDKVLHREDTTNICFISH